MKELLFRGRFKVNKFRWNGAPREYEFIESKTHHISAIHFNNNGDISHVVIPHKDTCITLFPDYFTTFDIQQYTGLKDKNGVKIFEGDRLMNEDCGDGFEDALYYDVIYNEKLARFELIEIGYPIALAEHGYDYARDLERLDEFIDIEEAVNCLIIGNIYDNPDLIK